MVSVSLELSRKLFKSTMFKFVLLVAIVGFSAVAAIDSEIGAETKTLENVISPAGESFHYAFQTSNGIDINSAGDAKVISGAYKYVSPEGQNVLLTYTADENGYHPSGDLLPTPPPIPAAIIRAVEWNLAHPQVQEALGRKL
ncbi:pupal cuticle protein Edg-78E-like [Episyrphus balteatus]|uniref:pupal cuticle protein Edg-78E-like n=1 Tax=Episyrphus balteatus TaxID=286459 RepID=UPI00248664A1|nr:pupal cuticle protein Edg-78E-like [Episyrphus balteatus]